MNLKLTFLTLSILLTIECLNAASTTRQTTADSQQKIAKRRLADFMMYNMNKISKTRMADSKRLAELVLKDPEVLAIKSTAMDRYLSVLLTFVRHVNEFGDQDFISWEPSPRPKLLMQEQSTLFNFFNKATSREGQLIKASLVRNGVAEQWNLLKPLIQEYADGFIRQAENYLASLSRAEKQKEIALQRTIEDLKNEGDAEKRFVKLQGYFQVMDIGQLL